MAEPQSQAKPREPSESRCVTLPDAGCRLVVETGPHRGGMMFGTRYVAANGLAWASPRSLGSQFGCRPVVEVGPHPRLCLFARGADALLDGQV
jgi:hypothetical protein